MHVLLIFLDGVGLGIDQPQANPFATANFPTLHHLTNGQRWLHQTGLQQTNRSLFIPTDATFNIPGRPQSGTGQAAIITGRKIPQIIGEHYGPKPNAATRDLINQGTIFSEVIHAGKTASLLEAYPPAWHQSILSGKRLPSS
ncbi:MAG: peptidase, partial [Phototrophicales bacterium]